MKGGYMSIQNGMLYSIKAYTTTQATQLIEKLNILVNVYTPFRPT